MAESQQFDCHACEFQSHREDISYDALGYPVCPICGTHHAPFEAELDGETTSA